MKKPPIFILTIMLVVMLTSIATTIQRTVAADAIVQQTCTDFTSGGWGSPGSIELVSDDGGFGLQNYDGPYGGASNDPTGQSCVHTFASGAWGWNFTKPNPTYDWFYPVQYDPRMNPTPIAGLTTAEIDFSATLQFTSPASSTLADFSWDVWLSDSSGALTDEMMIWMVWSNRTITNCSEFIFGCEWPAPFSFGSVNDGYNTYGLYEYENTVQQSLHVYRIQTQRIPTQINILPLIQNLIRLGRSPTDIESIDLGTEVWQGSGSVQVNSYSLRLGNAASTTIFEGPTSATPTSNVVTTSSSTQTITSSTSTSSTFVSSSATSSTSALVNASSSSQTTASSTTTSASLTSTSQTTTTTPRTPSISLNPSSGSVGSTVDVTGSGFSPSDTTCSMSGSVVASPTCSVSGGILTGAFTVANVATGSYSVTATGTQAGDSASASFTVPSPSLTFTPSSAQIGMSVDVTGSYFSKADTSCHLSGTPVGTSTCSISNGILSASFNVTSITPGTYTVTVTGSPDDDSASASFAVNGASISFNPTSAQVGSNVTVSGSGFSLSDTSCSLSGGSVVSQSCTLSGGRLTGSFTVANVTGGSASASYTVTATASPAGDSASGAFLVAGRMISLDPFYAPVGTPVQVDASGFSAQDSTCSVSGGSVTSATCSITNGLVTATFTVANVPPGTYAVTLKGEPVGDSATTDLTVAGPSLSIALNPDSGSPGTTVHVSGSGFLSSDSSCALTGSAVGSPSCSITSGTLSGSFTITTVSAGSYLVTAIGSPNEDIISATLSVTVASSSQTTTSSTTSTVPSPDFALKSASSITLTQGQSGSTTVIIVSLHGFRSPVTLSASWSGTLPAGVKLLIASPITPMANETGTSLLTVIASPTASIGTFTVQVEGTSGTLAHILSPNIAVQILQAASTASGTTSLVTSTSSVMTSVTSATASTTTSVTSVRPNATACPISTAVSSSALASSAQGLRDFRDKSILKTRTGAAFMKLFNAWYYSFSPSLAYYLGAHRTQRTVFSYALYPLIGLLYASYCTYALMSLWNNEVAAIAAGIVAAAMIGLIYLAPFLYLANRTFRRKISLTSRLDAKVLLSSSVASSVAIAFSYSAGMELALGLAAAGLLLSSLTLGVMAGIRALNCIKLTYSHLQLAVLNEVAKTLTHHPMRSHSFMLIHEKS